MNTKYPNKKKDKSLNNYANYKESIHKSDGNNKNKQNKNSKTMNQINKNFQSSNSKGYQKYNAKQK